MSNQKTPRRGRPPSPHKMVRILLNLPAPMVAALDRIAADTFEKRATVIRAAIMDRFEKDGLQKFERGLARRRRNAFGRKIEWPNASA